MPPNKQREDDQGFLVLQAARRHAWVVSSGEGSVDGPKRLRVLGGVDLVPGDHVLLEQGAIRQRLERRSALKRKTSRGEQTLAANIDDLLVISAAEMVEGGEGLVARCIAAALEERIRPVLVFNKADLDSEGRLSEEVETWGALGFDAFFVSAVDGNNMGSLEKRIRGRNVAFVGASGVGKSTIINALAPYAAQRTAEVNDQGRGRHTTSLGRAIPWEGGLLIDLPGVRSFGLFDSEALDKAYPDIDAFALGCRFTDCRHGPEPHCAVKNAVEDKKMPSSRLESWRRIRESILGGREGGSRNKNR